MKIIHSIIWATLFFSYSYAQAQVLQTIHYSGNINNRINIVFLGDGYTASEQTKFFNDATTLSEKLFKVSPYREYKSFFNIYAIGVVSNQSGASHPHTANYCPPTAEHPTEVVDNYFGSKFDGSGTHRSTEVVKWELAETVVSSLVPQVTATVILVNSPYLGGSSYGTEIVMTNSEHMIPIIQHELGHNLGDLKDEYDYDNVCNGPGGPNVTQETIRENIPWKHWITNPIPTAEDTKCTQIGLYQGANRCAQGWYRPSCNCKMKYSTDPFCSVCIEQMIRSFISSVVLIESDSPSNFSTIHLNYGESKGFAITTLKTDYSKSHLTSTSTPNATSGPMCVAANTIGYTWYLNGVVVGTPSNAYVLKIDSGPYDNNLCVRAYDRSHWLKEPAVQDMHCWKIEINH